MITNIYKYPELKRIDKDAGRYYIDSNNNPVPSVTTVLSNTSNKKDSIEQWRKRVGEEEANRITKKSTDIGSMVHESLELFLNGRDWDNFSEDPNDLIAKKITTKFINTGLNSITEVWGLEIGLILEGLYAGTADCVGKINGVPSIIDFKTSRKMKRREWIEDYFLQGCAYANAHNVMFGTEIQQVVILMVDRELLFQEFTVRPTEFNILTKVWKKRLIDFHKKYS
ncbi:MAG: preprotein translocase subunit TatA [Gammaproteobacteria bacterium]|nr:preprotein translocase subunit TatA [Gammaproteobacteria bacterium]OUW90061.1 MAG: preprotein translocase subunit TatA [Gammaproteobacteria bacterium TMED234]|tara:strand:- start:142 stop:819 length:678 start_codon:yes stop_codon:yes gene_type:complete